MDFNVGDRIHVTIYQEEEVDFYATLSFMGLGNFMMNNCSDKKFEDKWISMPDNVYFGIDECYYYTLAIEDDEKEDAKPTKEQLLAFAKDNNIESDPVIDDASAARHFRRQLDQYKTAHDKLTAGLKEAVAESIKYKRERDSLITDIKQQRELLKDFSRFIHRKVEACPGKKEYMDFRDRLNELGIGERE